MNPYKTLDVDQKADQETIKKAYRDASKIHHPDLHQGDDTKMKELNHAYMILSDPEKRKRYDETGETDQKHQNTPEQKAMAMLGELMAAMINQLGDTILRVNVVNVACEHVTNGREKCEEDLRMTKNKIKTLKKAQAKTKAKEGQNVLAGMIQAHIDQLQRNKAVAQEFLETSGRVLEILQNHEYDPDQEKPPTGMFGSTTGFTIRYR